MAETQGPAVSPSLVAPFPLTRYFVVTGLLTTFVVAAFLVWVTASSIRAEILPEYESFAERVAKNLNHQVHREFILPTLEARGDVDLDQPEVLAALDAVVRANVAVFDVQVVYFFDLEGNIRYSTNLEHRGSRVRDNLNFERAARGDTSSLLVNRGSPLDVSGRPGSVTLLETYVPVYALDAAGKETGEQTGVIEVYQDATRIDAEIQLATWRTGVYTAVAFVALMLALWLWVRKAERTIHTQTDAVLDANRRLAELSADLEQQVADRTRQLLRAETLATVGVLGAGVAHEVNNPVASIATCAQGLLRDLKEPANERETEWREYLEIIRDEAFRVKEITRGLLDFSRGSERGAETLDLGELLAGTVRLATPRARQDGKRIEVAEHEPLSLRADPAGLRQLTLNLTLNALDATPAGSVVTWRAARVADGVQLTCLDQGPGFSDDALAHGLEPFYSGKPAGQGTGLGLAIAYAVVRDHGGRIELSNSPEGGACVAITLPLEPPGAPT
ncbi:MAG: HAMP domain-containing histidine kinase [Planctomycetes bacterium]|nr:HAMP domain-containing histidine kinase [Planctomycetota bacterium]